MLYTIYYVFADSVTFIRKNPFVLLLFYLSYVHDAFVERFLIGTSMPERFVRFFVPLFVLATIEIYTLVVVRKREVAYKSDISIWQSFKSIYDRAFLLLALNSLLLFFCVIFIDLLFGLSSFFGSVLFFIAFCIFMISCTFGLRYLIFFDIVMVVDAVKAGIKEFFKNFIFYVLIIFAGLLIAQFPSLIFPPSWIVNPHIPIVELFMPGGQAMNTSLFEIFTYPLLSLISSLSLTYAFIHKNKNKIYDA